MCLYYEQLKHYIKHSKNGSIEITYDVPIIGRLTPNIIYRTNNIFKKEWICNQSYQWCETKARVAAKYYDDIDIINCQSVVLEQLMAHHNMNTFHMIRYNKHRERIIKNLMENNKWTRKETKIFIFHI